MDTQARLKYYEVELKPKQESYDTFMKSLIAAGDNARNHDHAALVHDLTDMELAYYKLDEFLAENNRENRDIIWKNSRSLARCVLTVWIKKTIRLSFLRRSLSTKQSFDTSSLIPCFRIHISDRTLTPHFAWPHEKIQY